VRLNNSIEKSDVPMKCGRVSILANKKVPNFFARRIAFIEAIRVQNLSERRESGFTQQKC
jgi:hypothetical protein